MNIDDIKQRYEPRDAKVFAKNNSALRIEIEKQTQVYLQKKREIVILPSCVSSPPVGFKENLAREANNGQIIKKK